MVIGHRWLAIGFCLLFIAWLVSGVVMMYVGFPELTDEERVGALERIHWRAIRVSPDAALQIASARAFPQRLVLEMLGGEPVYRIQTAGVQSVVSASDGRVIRRVDGKLASLVARRFSRDSEVDYLGPVERDQWTVSQRFDAHRPLLKFTVADGRGSEVYISSTSGELLLDTHSSERAWNRVGAVLHWLYFTELRRSPGIWRHVVLWASGIGIFVIVSGLWLGISRVRALRGGVTPFRGWLAWHHIAGLVGGVFLLTWGFSGWLSLEPNVPWSDEVHAAAESAGPEAYSDSDKPASGTALETLLTISERETRQAAFTWIAGRAWIVLTDDRLRTSMRDGTTGQPARLQTADILETARELVPGGTIAAWTLLHRDDSYWYSHHAKRKLPVLRITFNDKQQTFLYVDPDAGELLLRARRQDRITRWLFNGLHRWDFGALGVHRPLWDALVITLTLAGLMVSCSGAVMGWRRLGASRPWRRQHRTRFRNSPDIG